MKPQIRHAFTAVILLLWSATFAMGASVGVIPSGTAKFTIQGDSMDGVAGFDLVINYDGSLSSPTVTQERLISGAMMAANTNNPGSIKIAVISTKSFTGSGPIATITFARGTGNVRIASQNMINSSGASVSGSTTSGSASNITQQPGIPFSGSQQTTTTTPSGSSVSGSLGSVNIAPDVWSFSENC